MSVEESDRIGKTTNSETTTESSSSSSTNYNNNTTTNRFESIITTSTSTIPPLISNSPPPYLDDLDNEDICINSNNNQNQNHNQHRSDNNNYAKNKNDDLTNKNFNLSDDSNGSSSNESSIISLPNKLNESFSNNNNNTNTNNSNKIDELIGVDSSSSVITNTNTNTNTNSNNSNHEINKENFINNEKTDSKSDLDLNLSNKPDGYVENDSSSIKYENENDDEDEDMNKLKELDDAWDPFSSDKFVNELSKNIFSNNNKNNTNNELDVQQEETTGENIDSNQQQLNEFNPNFDEDINQVNSGQIEEEDSSNWANFDDQILPNLDETNSISKFDFASINFDDANNKKQYENHHHHHYDQTNLVNDDDSFNLVKHHQPSSSLQQEQEIHFQDVQNLKFVPENELSINLVEVENKSQVKVLDNQSVESIKDEETIIINENTKNDHRHSNEQVKPVSSNVAINHNDNNYDAAPAPAITVATAAAADTNNTNDDNDDDDDDEWGNFVDTTNIQQIPNVTFTTNLIPIIPSAQLESTNHEIERPQQIIFEQQQQQQQPQQREILFRNNSTRSNSSSTTNEFNMSETLNDLKFNFDGLIEQMFDYETNCNFKTVNDSNVDELFIERDDSWQLIKTLTTITDASDSLKFKWNFSFLEENYLKSLNVDRVMSQKELRNTPIFTHNTILQPIKLDQTKQQTTPTVQQPSTKLNGVSSSSYTSSSNQTKFDEFKLINSTPTSTTSAPPQVPPPSAQTAATQSNIKSNLNQQQTQQMLIQSTPTISSINSNILTSPALDLDLSFFESKESLNNNKPQQQQPVVPTKLEFNLQNGSTYKLTNNKITGISNTIKKSESSSKIYLDKLLEEIFSNNQKSNQINNNNNINQNNINNANHFDIKSSTVTSSSSSQSQSSQFNLIHTTPILPQPQYFSSSSSISLSSNISSTIPTTTTTATTTTTTTTGNNFKKDDDLFSDKKSLSSSSSSSSSSNLNELSIQLQPHKLEQLKQLDLIYTNQQQMASINPSRIITSYNNNNNNNGSGSNTDPATFYYNENKPLGIISTKFTSLAFKQV